MAELNSDSPKQPTEAAPVGPFRAWTRRVMRPVLAGLGLFLIIIAIPLAWATPFLPFGLPLGILGVVLLGTNSVWGRNWMESVLHKHPWIERMAPKWLMRKVFNREKRPPEVLKGKKKEAPDAAQS